MKNWYTIKAQAGTAPAEVSIYGDIGAWGVSAAQFIADVQAVPGPILVRVNSSGGDVFDGLAMYHYLASRGNVETVIDGVAASAASLPFLAGSKRKMPESAYLMVHNPWSGVMGNSSEMRKVADTLDMIGQGLASVYSKVTGMTVDAVKSLMDAETWLLGSAALAGGWATELVDLGPVKASVRSGRYAKTPTAILAAAPDGLMIGDYVDLTYAGGATKGQVVEIITSGTAVGADGMIDASAEDPAAIVDVLRETTVPGQFEEADVQVARLFSTLTRTAPPVIVETETTDAASKTKISASTNAGKNHMSKTAKLFALLGVQPAAEDMFLASAIADLGVTPEAVTEARKAGTTDFLATHITDRIAKADARAMASESILASACAAFGITVPKSADEAASSIKSALDERISKAAAEALAARGIPSARVNAKTVGTPSTELTGFQRAVALNKARNAALKN